MRYRAGANALDLVGPARVAEVAGALLRLHEPLGDVLRVDLITLLVHQLHALGHQLLEGLDDLLAQGQLRVLVVGVVGHVDLPAVSLHGLELGRGVLGVEEPAAIVLERILLSDDTIVSLAPAWITMERARLEP